MHSLTADLSCRSDSGVHACSAIGYCNCNTGGGRSLLSLISLHALAMVAVGAVVVTGVLGVLVEVSVQSGQ